ncbi:hypothetical protein VTO42DRAFT_2464 [Malbranchea cinnamomea]
MQCWVTLMQAIHKNDQGQECSIAIHLNSMLSGRSQGRDLWYLQVCACLCVHLGVDLDKETVKGQAERPVPVFIFALNLRYPFVYTVLYRYYIAKVEKAHGHRLSHAVRTVEHAVINVAVYPWEEGRGLAALGCNLTGSISYSRDGFIVARKIG